MKLEPEVQDQLAAIVADEGLELVSISINVLRFRDRHRSLWTLKTR
jgi:hypothetical protein